MRTWSPASYEVLAVHVPTGVETGVVVVTEEEVEVIILVYVHGVVEPPCP